MTRLSFKEDNITRLLHAVLERPIVINILLQRGRERPRDRTHVPFIRVREHPDVVRLCCKHPQLRPSL